MRPSRGVTMAATISTERRLGGIVPSQVRAWIRLSRAEPDRRSTNPR
jgi:hypothetical protein